mmetsp:Transcript_20568/g.38352  ORF Transcript_20568/g.38352 Transcript_20568/m.38352 type:complete len:273 (-) Transcript_20568:826-1644(-)
MLLVLPAATGLPRGLLQQRRRPFVNDDLPRAREAEGVRDVVEGRAGDDILEHALLVAAATNVIRFQGAATDADVKNHLSTYFFYDFVASEEVYALERAPTADVDEVRLLHIVLPSRVKDCNDGISRHPQHISSVLVNDVDDAAHDGFEHLPHSLPSSTCGLSLIVESVQRGRKGSRVGGEFLALLSSINGSFPSRLLVITVAPAPLRKLFAHLGEATDVHYHSGALEFFALNGGFALSLHVSNMFEDEGGGELRHGGQVCVGVHFLQHGGRG